MTDLIDQLRANLRAAAIPATDADFAGIEAKGFLSRLADFERIVTAVDNEALPDFLDAGALPAPPARGSDPPQLTTLPERASDILTVASQLRAGATTPMALAEAALARVAELDTVLNVFQMVTADAALAAARQAEAELAAGHDRGPLHGVPVAIKDLFDSAGLPTAAGSQLRAAVVAETDATVVARLRAAGAVIVGKTRMSEFAYSPGSNNGHYGPTANPFDRSRDSGGSSSGSGVAVAVGMVYGALGSDTGGSIRIPAALCGIVGLKPTFGRASLAGGMPLSWSLDHPGPLARTVADAALLLEVIAGSDPRDGRTLQSVPPFRAGALDAGVAGLRVGVLRDDGTGQPLATDEQLAGWRRGLAALEAAGATLVELDMPELDALRVLNGALLALEASALHLPWLQTRLDDYGEFMRQRVLAAFAYGPGALVRAQQARAVLRRRSAALFNQVDLLTLPCQPDTAPPLGTPAPTVFTGPFNCLGWPAISLPTGLSTAGLPLAMQIVARPWDEETMVRAAFTVERALGLTPA